MFLLDLATLPSDKTIGLNNDASRVMEEQNMWRHRRDDGGFTLVELMTVVLVISVLMAVAIPSFFGARARAQDRTTQANMTTAVKAEASFSASGNGFTTSVAVLSAEEPSLDWSGATDQSIHVVVGDVLPGDSAQVLIYSKSNTSTWFGVRMVVAGASAGQYTCSGSAEANVDDLADCTGNDW